MKPFDKALAAAVALLLLGGSWYCIEGMRWGYSPSPSRSAANQIRLFLQALDEYHLDEERYPAALEELTTVQNPAGEPYLHRIPLDPWERPYLYALTDDGRPLVLSLGADGEPGGSGDDADVTSETVRGE